MKAIPFAAELTDIVYDIKKQEEATSQAAREEAIIVMLEQ